MPKITISADDLHCWSLMKRRNYCREHIVAPLEERLAWLKQESDCQSWPWLKEERQRVELEIAEAQRTTGAVEAEIKGIGKDADVPEGIDMDENYHP